jgi:hypothetical protein
MANFMNGLLGLSSFQNGMTSAQDAQLQRDLNKMKVDQIKAEADRHKKASQDLLDFLANNSEDGQLTIPPPPKMAAMVNPTAPTSDDSAPANPPPAPGQPSVPMVQPSQQMQQPPQQPPQQPQQPPQTPSIVNAGQIPTGNRNNPSWQIPPQLQAQRTQQQIQIIQNELKTEQDPGNRAALQRELSRLTGIPPYQSLSGGASATGGGGAGGGGNIPQPQASPTGLPPPPSAPPQTPRPNSMSIQDAAKFLKSRGVTDPEEATEMLGMLAPYLNNEAKQQAQIMLAEDRGRKIAEQERHNQASEGTAKERADTGASAADNQNRNRDLRTTAVQENADTARMKASAAIKAAETSQGKKLSDAGAAVYDEMVLAGKTVPKNRRGEVDVDELNRLGDREKGGAGSGSIVTSQAEYKADASSLSKQTTTSDAIDRGGKKIALDVDTLKKYMPAGASNGWLHTNKAINQLKTEVQDPALGQFALAAKQVGTEYEKLLQGGALSAAQLHAGAAEDAKALLNEDMSPEKIMSILPVILQEIENGKKASADKVEEIKYRMNQQKINPTPGATPKPPPTNAKGWVLRKDKDGNQAYVSPDGTQYEEIK